MAGRGWIAIGACAGALLASDVAHAQGFVPSKDKVEPKLTIPKAYMPPAGLCRVWIDNVPAAQQPAPTDCVSAIKNRPTNGRVIFGDDDLHARKKSAKDREDRGKDADERSKSKRP